MKTAQEALNDFLLAREHAKTALENIVKEHGGFISMIPVDNNKQPVYALMDYDISPSGFDTEHELIYGIRYVEGEGLLLFTESCLENYEYNEDYCFSNTVIVEKDSEDYKHLENAMKDEKYFISIEEPYIILSNTLISILAGMQNYL